MAEKTLGEFLTSALSERRGSNLFLSRSGGAWRFLSVADVERRVRELAAGLLTYGVEPGGCIGLLSESRPEALIADLAIQLCGGMSVPIAPDVSSADLHRILSMTEARLVLLSGARQLDRILEIRPELPSLDLVLLFDRPEAETVIASTSVDTACSVGARRLVESPDLLEAAARAPNCAGGVRLIALALSRENLINATLALESVVELGPRDTVLCLLPVSRVAQRTFQYASLRRGAIIAFGGSIRDCLEVRPTVLVAERELFESLARDLLLQIRDRSWLGRETARWAVRKGRERAHADLALGRLPSSRPWPFRLADRFSLRGLRREATGGRLRLFVSLGLPLPEEVTGFLHACGFPVLEGYDLDEVSGLLAIQTPLAMKPGTVGRPVPGLEARIGAGGELQVRGPMVAGPSAGLRHDRWVATGRFARVDDGGRLIPAS